MEVPFDVDKEKHEMLSPHSTNKERRRRSGLVAVAAAARIASTSFISVESRSNELHALGKGFMNWLRPSPGNELLSKRPAKEISLTRNLQYVHILNNLCN
jgi:hypothetical protein